MEGDDPNDEFTAHKKCATDLACATKIIQSAANLRNAVYNLPEDRTGDGKVDCDDYFMMMQFGIFGDTIVPNQNLTQLYGYGLYRKCIDVMESRGLLP